MASWQAAMKLIAAGDIECSMLAYDRYGQGATTDRDPNDAKAEDPKHGHDLRESARDLKELLLLMHDRWDTRIVFVANSIGCPLARLYVQDYPGQVAGILLLDSNITNTNFVDIFPDPDAEGFDASKLPDGVDAEGLRAMRTGMGAKFHPSISSAEGLSRKNITQLLPRAERPRLLGWRKDPNGPYVTVVGHGHEAFAQEGLKMMGVPLAVTDHYMNPFWDKYNQGLTNITSSKRAKGPIEAVGAGHFVQMGRPDLVAEEVKHIVKKIRDEYPNREGVASC